MTHNGSGSSQATKHSVESANINGHHDSVNNGKVDAVNGISLANTATTGTGDLSDNAINACHTSSLLSVGESGVTVDGNVDHDRVAVSTDVTARPPKIDNLRDVQSEVHDCKIEHNNAKHVKPSTDGTGDIRPRIREALPSTDNVEDIYTNSVDVNTGICNSAIKASTKEVEPSAIEVSPVTDNIEEVQSSTIEASPVTDNIEEVESSTIEEVALSINETCPFTDNTKEVELNAIEASPCTNNAKQVESSTIEASPCTDNTNEVESRTIEASPCTDNTNEVESRTIEASPYTDNTNEVESRTIEVRPCTDNTKEVKSSTIEANAKEVEPGTIEASPSTDNAKEVEPGTIEANAKEVESSTIEANAKEVESSTIEANAKEVESRTIEANAKEVESRTIEANAKEVESRTIEANAKEVESRTIEANAKEVESSTIEANAKEVESRTIEANAKEVESRTIEANAKEVESRTIEANAKEVESSTHETKQCIDKKGSQLNTDGGPSVDDNNIVHQCTGATKPLTHDANIAKENSTDPRSSSLNISDAEHSHLPESELSHTCCEPCKSSPETRPSVNQQDDVKAKGDATGHELSDNDIFASDISNSKDGQIVKEGIKSPIAGVDQSAMSNGTSTPIVGKGCDKMAEIKSNTVGSPRSSHEKHRHGHRRRRPKIKRTKSDSAADMACKFELPLNPGVITIYTSTTPSPKKDDERRVRPTSMSDMPKTETVVETTHPRYYARSPGVSPTKSATYQLVTETIAHLTQHSASEPKKSRSPRHGGRSKSRDSSDVTSPKHRSPVSAASSPKVSPSAMTTPKKTIPVATASPTPSNVSDIAGAHGWNLKSRKAYGICMSLYDQNPVSGKISGESQGYVCR